MPCASIAGLGVPSHRCHRFMCIVHQSHFVHQSRLDAKAVFTNLFFLYLRGTTQIPLRALFKRYESCFMLYTCCQALYMFKLHKGTRFNRMSS